MSDLIKHQGKDLERKISDKINLSSSKLATLSKALSKKRPRIFYQLIIFVIDGSNSMNAKTKERISRAQAVHNSVTETLDRINRSKNRECFDLCFIYFSDDFTVDIECQNITTLDQNNDYNPLRKITPRGTFAEGALKEAFSIGRQYCIDNESNDHQVLINLLSDGSFDDRALSKKVIDQIHKEDKFEMSCQYFEREIDFSTTYYAWDEANDEIDKSSPCTPEEAQAYDKKHAEKFKKFVTQPELFLSSTNTEIIRNHMIKSISVVSKLLD
ncbi:von Willebrand factor type A domain-containing protein [Roseivirga pacifica]|uniref:von Willebrand factor type A domain-containing protein n=1 Tax=Roseivirga pacifica TaxID=1267423 RepID=A0A1I0QHI3_9BACT|nr:vWA domain-containing protein [Roseivirga pacifica]RKQ42909.1 von Willebrand factor type A domain-containing protein [Roseivirga pacifica]SEW26537.1 von Willebrand factor type A domain-containing protein [Roseivirga pacifica]